MGNYGYNLFGGGNCAILFFIILFLLLFANGDYGYDYDNDIVD